MRTYQKTDAQMTRGLAILCMVMLHLFCRKGNDVLGTPLLWINESTPVVYLFGFFAEICVPLYSICVGYAQELLYRSNRSDFRSRCSRILRLMINYWIILGIFAILGLIFDSDHGMPGSVWDFAKSIVLLHSYNGAWWYLNTYVLLMLLPPALLLLPVEKLTLVPGLLVCGSFHVIWYALGKLGITSVLSFDSPILQFVQKEANNLIGVLAYIWVGGFLCKYDVVARLSMWYEQKVPKPKQKIILFLLVSVVFAVTNVVHKWVIMGGVALVVFLIFNIWPKGKSTQKVMLFLGKHSTNIWLVHMFFYAYFLKDFVLWCRNPVFMLASLLALSILTSYVVMYINRLIIEALERSRKARYDNKDNYLS